MSTISLPRWSQEGRARRRPLLGQEEHVSLFLAIMSMLLLKYHKATPEHVDESQVDQQSERMTVDITDAAGNTTEQERAIYFSVRTYTTGSSTQPHGAPLRCGGGRRQARGALHPALGRDSVGRLHHRAAHADVRPHGYHRPLAHHGDGDRHARRAGGA